MIITKYFKIGFLTLFIIMLCNLQGLSQFSSVRLVYTNDYLQGGQLELSVNKGIKNLPVSFELAGALTPDLDSYSVKFGSNYCFNISEMVNFSVGFRTVHTRFMKDYLGNRQRATYFDFPIRLDFKVGESVFPTLTFIPTYNTYNLLNEKIILQGSIGLGYNF